MTMNAARRPMLLALSTFGLQDHPQRKSSAKCSTKFGQYHVDSNASGNDRVRCHCVAPGMPATNAMLYGMEPGVLGAQEQCFLEVKRCEIEKDHCPGGCEKGNTPGNHNDIWN